MSIPNATHPMTAGQDEVPPLLEVRGLTKHYDGFSLEGISLRVVAGEVVGLVGKNGAGKSTTMKALLGLVLPDAGEGQVLGCDLAQMPGEAGVAAKERIGVVFDTLAMPPHLRVHEVARLMDVAYAAWDPAAFEALRERFGLDARRKLSELSRGQGMKLSLACALAHDPDLLILDEATAGLDPMARDEVLDLLRAFVAQEGPDGEPVHGVLLSSHITSDLDKIADEVVCIDEGRIAFRVMRDEVCDQMGVARCRAADVERLVRLAAAGEAGFEPGEPLRAIRHEYGTDVLVPDRFALARRDPSIPCDRLDIDTYMALVLRGEELAVAGGAADGSVPADGVAMPAADPAARTTRPTHLSKGDGSR